MPDDPGIKGGVFSDTLPDKRAGARIRLGRYGIEAETSTGQHFTLAYLDLVLEQGGASGKMIFCHSPDRRLTIYTEEEGFLAELARAGGAYTAEKVDGLKGAQREVRARSRNLLIVGLLLLLVLGYGAWRGVVFAAANAVDALPVSVDQKIGAVAMETMPLQGKKVTDPVLVEAVQAIVDRLAPHASLPGMTFEVTVVDAPIVNAFCLPGGKIVLYTGLLKAAETPEQVAGVLAHEMAHATKRHGLKALANSVGLAVGVNLLLGDISGVVALAVELAKEGVLTSHGRDLETESDLEAVRMMRAAQLDPLALAEFFSILEKEKGDVPGLLAWLSTHPQLADRREAIHRETGKLAQQQPVPLALDWERVVQHAKNPGAVLDSKR